LDPPAFVIRAFVVDDHALIRRTYAEEIEEAGGLTTCGTAASFAEALEALPEAGPDVALIDIALERDGPSGLELIRRLNTSMNGSEPCWLVVSAYDDPATVERASEAGADAFLSKRDAGDALLETICEMVGEDAA
jgi:DNA-binding NarL/FixJ family response regulator